MFFIYLMLVGILDLLCLTIFVYTTTSFFSPYRIPLEQTNVAHRASNNFHCRFSKEPLLSPSTNCPDSHERLMPPIDRVWFFTHVQPLSRTARLQSIIPQHRKNSVVLWVELGGLHNFPDATQWQNLSHVKILQSLRSKN